MVGLLELSDQEFKTTRTNMRRDLMDTVDSTKEKMDHVREAVMLKKNQKEMLEIKNNVIQMKTAFSELISRLYIAEGRISELETISEQLRPNQKAKKKYKAKNK
jgi:exonuclease VII large subunit